LIVVIIIVIVFYRKKFAFRGNEVEDADVPPSEGGRDRARSSADERWERLQQILKN